MEDLDRLVDMAEQFIASSPYANAGTQRKDLEQMGVHILQNGVVFIHDKGFIAGILSPIYFAPHIQVATELAWWSPTGGGQELRYAFEKWARDIGAKGVTVSVLNNKSGPSVVEQLSTDGYMALEACYIKAI